MDDHKTSFPQKSPSGAGTATSNDSIGKRFRLEPGNPRNPDYSRSFFIQRVSDSAVLGAIKEAQKQQRQTEKNLFKPSFIHEAKAAPPLKSFIPKGFPKTAVYVMAANGIPTTYLQKKSASEPASSNANSDLAPITHTAEDISSILNGFDDSTKSSDVWKEELPQHIKSLKFMIEVLNDRHSHPEEFASASLHDIPAPFFGPKYKELEGLNDTWADPVFPYPGDRIFPPVNRKEVILAERPPFYLDQQSTEANSFARLRSKSGCSDLFYDRYFNLCRQTKPLELDNGILNKSFCEEDLSKIGAGNAISQSADGNGVFVVEEIIDDEEEEELKLLEAVPVNGDKIVPEDFVCTAGREFGNISPISEEISEPEKETQMDESCPTLSADTTAELSLISRLNCSSPILAHSPSLRKTPIFSNVLQDTPPSSGARRFRKLTRALHDISDREEERDSSCDEKTESFEIDLETVEDKITFLNLISSFEKNSLENSEQDGVKPEYKESLDDPSGKRTVWETLSANIEAHIGDGNPAGFVSGPIDHPLQIPDPPEVEYPSYMYYNAPLKVIPELP